MTTNENQTVQAPATPELLITRTFDAPASLVFQAWSEPERLAKWWGPAGYAIEIKKLEFRPGGIFHYYLKAANGHDMWGRFVYREIVSPKHISWVSSFSDEAGNVTRAFFNENFPLEVLNKITFVENGGKTTLTLRSRPVSAGDAELAFYEKMFPSMQQGFKGTFDQLEIYLSEMAVTGEVMGRELVLSRVFNAPPSLVFDAWTHPEHVVNWWGPYGFTTTNQQMDARPGGSWRFMMHGPDGRNYPNKIVFIEVDKPRRLAYKHAGDSDTEPVNFHVTVDFEEVGGKTKLTMRMVFDSAAELDRVDKEYGAVEGAFQTLARLGNYLPGMAR